MQRHSIPPNPLQTNTTEQNRAEQSRAGESKAALEQHYNSIERHRKAKQRAELQHHIEHFSCYIIASQYKAQRKAEKKAMH